MKKQNSYPYASDSCQISCQNISKVNFNVKFESHSGHLKDLKVKYIISIFISVFVICPLNVKKFAI